jgi:hypothetical protein
MMLSPYCIPFVLQVQLFDFRSRPRSPSQELQAGLYARFIIKASDIDDLPHFLPTMMFHQLSKHHFKRDTVKRVFMLSVAHIHSILLTMSSYSEKCRARRESVKFVGFRLAPPGIRLFD